MDAVCFFCFRSIRKNNLAWTLRITWNKKKEIKNFLSAYEGSRDLAYVAFLWLGFLLFISLSLLYLILSYLQLFIFPFVCQGTRHLINLSLLRDLNYLSHMLYHSYLFWHCLIESLDFLQLHVLENPLNTKL